MTRSLRPRSANSSPSAGHRRRGAWITVGVAAAAVIVAAVRPGDARSGAPEIGRPATVRPGRQETPVDSAPRTWLEMKNVHLRGLVECFLIDDLFFEQARREKLDWIALLVLLDFRSCTVVAGVRHRVAHKTISANFE